MANSGNEPDDAIRMRQLLESMVCVLQFCITTMAERMRLMVHIHRFAVTQPCHNEVKIKRCICLATVYIDSRSQGCEGWYRAY